MSDKTAFVRRQSAKCLIRKENCDGRPIRHRRRHAAHGAAQGRGHREGRPRLPAAAAARRNARLRPGPARRALFIAATYNGEAFPFDLFELRAVDEAISDDMLLCIDALRWGQSDLHSLVPDGDRRVRAVIEKWGLKWPESL